MASMQAVTRVNAEQASKRVMRKPTRLNFGEGCHREGSERRVHLPDSAGVVATACRQEEDRCNTGSPMSRSDRTIDRTPARDRPGEMG